jgi:hypothetical protein
LARSTVNQSHAAIWRREQGRPVGREQIAHEETGHQDGDDFGDEDDRVLREGAWIELAQRVDRRRSDDFGIEQTRHICLARHIKLQSERLAANHQEMFDDRP